MDWGSYLLGVWSGAAVAAAIHAILRAIRMGKVRDLHQFPYQVLLGDRAVARFADLYEAKKYAWSIRDGEVRDA